MVYHMVMQWTTYNSYLQLLKELDWDKIRVVVLCGLPGSGKSSLGLILEEALGYKYVSSDIARVEVLKLTKAKFCSNEEYQQNTERIYDFMREQLRQSVARRGKITLDATHLNAQRIKSLELCQSLGIAREELIVIYVDAGSKTNVQSRFANRTGENKDGRSWLSAWEEAYDYFADLINSGKVQLPKNNEKGYRVVWVRNY